MALVEYSVEGNAAVLTMNSGENRFNFPFFTEIFDVLDEIEKKTDATVLITRSSDPKIWCNGIDLDWLTPVVQNGKQALANKFYSQMYSLFRRVLTYPMITVAAITGHAFAGGAFLAFSHDFRFMRNDRGWLCLPEVNLKKTLGQVLIALARRALPEYLFEEMEFTGRRLTAQECEEHRIIRKACSMDDLMKEALAFASNQNKDRDIIHQMKLQTHERLLGIIDQTINSMMA